MKTYKVVHFMPQLEEGVFSTKGLPVEQQVENVIRQHASEGWDFVNYQTCHLREKPGCLGALFGKKEEIVYYDIMIFSK